MQWHLNSSFKSIAVAMEEYLNVVLDGHVYLVLNSEEKPDVWCQNMMLTKAVPQCVASDYLKVKHCIETVFLPEPEEVEIYREEY